MSARFLFLLFLFISSCAQLKPIPPHADLEKALSAVTKIGEGRGRLSINQQQYLFSFDALLKDDQNWLLAASFPLHGEEVITLSRLSEEKVETSGKGSLENRIEMGMTDYLTKRGESAEVAQNFINSLRSLMRLLFAPEFKLSRKCAEGVCELGADKFQVFLDSKGLSIKKEVAPGYQLEFLAENLTDSIFMRTNFYLHSEKDTKKASTLLSLELFWK